MASACERIGHGPIEQPEEFATLCWKELPDRAHELKSFLTWLTHILRQLNFEQADSPIWDAFDVVFEMPVIMAQEMGGQPQDHVETLRTWVLQCFPDGTLQKLRKNKHLLKEGDVAQQLSNECFVLQRLLRTLRRAELCVFDPLGLQERICEEG